MSELQGLRVYCISMSSFGIVLDGHHVSRVHLNARRKVGYMLRVASERQLPSQFS